MLLLRNRIGVKSPNYITFWLFIWWCILVSQATGAGKSEAQFNDQPKLVFVTYVGNEDQVRKALILVQSIREFGGQYRNCPIYIVVDTAGVAGYRLNLHGLLTVPVQIDASVRGYPYAIKAFAAAAVETLVADTTHTLLWFDPETILIQEPKLFELKKHAGVALRPVFLVNQIGLPPGAPLDAFWRRIYQATGVDSTRVPVVETLVERQKIRAYYNCGIFAVQPRRGIFREWARVMTELLADQKFQRAACHDFRHRIFLHQAVVSAIIISRCPAHEIRLLPPHAVYPLQQHPKISPKLQAKTMNDVIALIHESAWNEPQDWRKILPCREPLRTWLYAAHHNFFKVTDQLYREEQSCNSYLITTPVGNVIIDPGGARDAASWLHQINDGAPIKAILLTHGHEDHRTGIGGWKKEATTPVIANQAYIEFLTYQDRLAGFFAVRTAAQTGQPAPPDPTPNVVTPIEPTVFFRDQHLFEVGGFHFELYHTPGETPDHATIWIPELKAAFVGDNFYTSFPNLYTLRGTRPRWALEYIQALEFALKLEPEILLPGHGEPVLGRERVRRKLTEYRDAIRYVHDATVTGMNAGKDVFTLMQEIQLPAHSSVGEFYGRVSWSVRGIYEGYAGWFDGNPATMYPDSPRGIYPELVQLAGGAESIIRRAQELLQAGAEVQVLHLCDVALTSQPNAPQALEVRLAALKALHQKSRNYIERKWLEHGMQQTEIRLKATP
ncbi:MBL fold metallo-hydrolase [candidate division KSB1 bacterium]|nr:MBL fold metallo-hydrolase [candidate division KSB1 bacterium]